MKYIVVYQTVPEDKISTLSDTYTKVVGGRVVYRVPVKVVQYRTNGLVHGFSWPKIINNQLSCVRFSSKDYGSYFKYTVHHIMTDQKTVYCSFKQSEEYEANTLKELYDKVREVNK